MQPWIVLRMQNDFFTIDEMLMNVIYIKIDTSDEDTWVDINILQTLHKTITYIYTIWIHIYTPKI